MSTPTYTMPTPIRASAVLTTGEVFHEIVEAKDLISNCNQLSLYINFTKGSLTNALVKVYTSQDGTNWHAMSDITYSAGVGTVSPIVLTLTASAAFTFQHEINTKFIKVGVQGTGTVTNSLMSIGVNLGNK